MEFLTAFAVGLTFAIGLYQVLRRNVIRAAIGLMLTTNAVTLFLFSTGSYHCNQAAYLSEYTGIPCDALPQALILTAIVISLGLSAFVLSLIYVVAWRYKTSNSDTINSLKH